MATRKTTDEQGAEITIARVTIGKILVHVRGTTPLILHRMSEKARHELLFPKGKKTAAEKGSSLKHDPMEEFRSSPEILRDPKSPTLLAMPSTAFKGALRTAALDQPGAKKSQIGRLTFVPGEFVGIYGVPQILTNVTRNSDMNRTPDIRTRAILPEWGAIVPVHFVTPNLRESSIVNLMFAAGVTVGIGDFRPERGAGNYGQFEVVNDDDPQLRAIIKSGGRAAQEAAMKDPAAYDEATAELLSWFAVEVKRRGFTVAA